MILDITIPARAWEIAELQGDPAGVDATCAEYGTAGFDGAELAVTVLRLPVRTVGAAMRLCTRIDAAEALLMRGAVVVTGPGRLGVTLGAGAVLEPAGRQWAIITADTTRYVWAGLAPTVTYTSGRAS